ncbi:MAG: SEC-C domain-containing protein [Proteobacteria bacterium]|nr:SEC-C domain-containing protein [Pseudomonadota bacterium]
MTTCPCGSEISYSDCCEPIIKKTRKAKTAVELMRARYSAYAKVETDFLFESLHPDKREGHDLKETRSWAEKSSWTQLEIIEKEQGEENDEIGTVEFIAHYSIKGERTRHHELATFVKLDGDWYFDDGEGVAPKQVIRSDPKIGRNDPCPCNSGKKFKKCCGK